MKHLVLIRIKNSNFDFEKYGIDHNYFTIDISQSLSYSKNVGVTQYALLDGTTRVDNISREPATLNFTGILGEVRAGGSDENFVRATISRTRLQNQMDLLEALRDQAIFLDFITDERTYKNYLITGINFGKNKFAEITVSLSIREILTFGDKIDVIENNKTKELSPYEQSLILDRFYAYNIESDSELVSEINRIVTSSVLSTSFVIVMGSSEMNPDVVINSYLYDKKNTSVSLASLTDGGSIKVSDTNRLYTAGKATEHVSGTVIGSNYLHVSFPQISKGKNLYDTRITAYARPGGLYSYLYTPISTTAINIRLRNQDSILYSVNTREFLMEPRYSNINSGVHPLNTTSSSNDIISEYKYGLNFIRKKANGEYSVLNNLLNSSSKGYMYNATYEKTEGSRSRLYPVLVYIHPMAWEKIRAELKRVWSESKYFRDKRVTGL